MSSFDLVIQGATVFDGTGARTSGRCRGRGDRIAAVGAAIEAGGAASLDAGGLAVAPGFLDVHTHDDFAVVLHPEMGFKVLGGVTTVVVGNCGMGAAPHAQARGYAAAFHPGHTLPEWDGYAGYLDHLDAAPASCNVAALVGHGAVRAAAMGARRGDERQEPATGHGSPPSGDVPTGHPSGWREASDSAARCAHSTRAVNRVPGGGVNGRTAPSPPATGNSARPWGWTRPGRPGLDAYSTGSIQPACAVSVSLVNSPDGSSNTPKST